MLFRSLHLPLDRAIATVREHLDEVRDVGGMSVLLWHPNAADERRFPGWWPVYLAALDHLAAGGAWVATGAGVRVVAAARGEAERKPEGHPLSRWPSASIGAARRQR